MGYCRRQKGSQGQREKECLLKFKIAFVYNMVTMGLFLTVSKSKSKIRLSSGDWKRKICILRKKGRFQGDCLGGSSPISIGCVMVPQPLKIDIF